MRRQRSGTDTIKFHILPYTPNGKGKHTIKTAKNKNSKSRKTRGDGQQAILNRMKRQTERRRTFSIRINHNRSTAVERSAKTGWSRRGGGGGGLKPVLR